MIQNTPKNRILVFAVVIFTPAILIPWFLPPIVSLLLLLAIILIAGLVWRHYANKYYEKALWSSA